MTGGQGERERGTEGGTDGRTDGRTEGEGDEVMPMLDSQDIPLLVEALTEGRHTGK